MKISHWVLGALIALTFINVGSAQTFSPLNHQLLHQATNPLLLTDGSVIVQDLDTPNWYKLTPDNTGSYTNGVWTQIASMAPNYGPIWYTSAVLPDGRVVVMGGEYNEGNVEVWTNLGAIYDPKANTWTSLAAPSGWTQIGDAQCVVLPNGTLMMANPFDSRMAAFDALTNTWTNLTTTGKVDRFDEEGWELLPDGTILTVDALSSPGAEKFIPWTNTWVAAGSTPQSLEDPATQELGPAVLRFDGTVFATGATGHTAIYTPPGTPTDPGAWVAGPDFPIDSGSGKQIDIEDGPACLLTNGNVLCAASPGSQSAPTTFYEFDGTHLNLIPGPSLASSLPSFRYCMVTLPNGQVFVTCESGDIELYTPAGSPSASWKPTITSVASEVLPSQDYPISGTQFNGLSQTSFYGDDVQSATNYPIVRITNNATGHVFYCRSHDHSTMAVATGSATVSTNFTVPASTESGPSTIQVIANGIASDPTPITVDALTVQAFSIAPAAIPSGSNATGTITLFSPAPSGGVTVNLSSNNPASVVPSTVTVAATATTATFPITTHNTGYTQIPTTITESFPAEPNHTAPLTVNPSDYSSFVGQTVPTSMGAAEHYTVTVQFKNTGGTTWDTAHSFKIRSMNPTGNLTWGTNRIALSNSPVAPGGTGSFTATLLAPATSGTYKFQWQMVQDSIGLGFGPSSTLVSVTVAQTADEAQFVSQSSVPTTIAAGTDFSPTLVFKNVGTASWSSAGGYLLKSRNPYNNSNWGTTTVALPATTAAGSSATFTPTFTAPATPGTYGFQWSMMHGGSLFGDLSNNVQVVVTLGSNDASFVSITGVPLSVGPGTTINGVVTFTNLGTATWDSTYSMVSRNPYLNTNWGTSTVAVVGTVAQSAQAVFSHAFTAPTTPGTYHFKWRMSHGGVPFGQESADLAVVVSADAAHYVSKTGATTVNAGQDFYVQYTMQNTGTSTWTSATNFNLRTISPLDNITWGRNRGFLPGSGSIAPGASVTITALCTAPTTPGAYTMQWQMNHISQLFGEATPLINMTVVQGADGATFVSQTGIPTSIPHGTTFTPTITMKNTGTAAWSGPTYSLASIGNNTFGVSSIASGSVAAGSNGVFSTTFTAPVTPGTYTFQMRMQDGTTKFGAPTTLFTITVT